MKKILYVTDRSCNRKAMDYILAKMSDIYSVECDIIGLNHYSNIGIKSQKNYDVLIYHTFPHQYHREKWNGSLIESTDDIFNKFDGVKIFHDSHDSGRVDAFSRFDDDNIFRIKAWPSYDYINKFNPILTTIGGMGQLQGQLNFYFESITNQKFIEWNNVWPNDKENDNVSYIVSYGYDEKWAADYPTYISQSDRNRFIREDTRDLLKSYKKVKVDMERKSQSEFHNHLGETLVSITVPGWGEGCLRQYEAPLMGCLNLMHESISDIKLLPHQDLIDGEDFISFNLDNLYEKLDYIFDNRDEIDKIRFNGKLKLHNGFDIEKSAKKLYKKLFG
jgi:hypothetical protein